MNIFDEYIKNTLEILRDSDVKRLPLPESSWEIAPKNTFLMDRDTAVELGGYPKESINLIIPSSMEGIFAGEKCNGENSSAADENVEGESLAGEISSPADDFHLEDGAFCIGSAGGFKGREKQISFGKIVLLETEELSDDEIYDFTQAELLTDSRIYMKDLMLRQSPTHYNINLRVGKNAVKKGFDEAFLGKSVYSSFKNMKHVKKAAVILIFGDSPLYKNLYSIAEKVKSVTLTLNHIFDGVDMDCGHCDMSVVCNEVSGLREMHRGRFV